MTRQFTVLQPQHTLESFLTHHPLLSISPLQAFNGLEGELAGKYYELGTMTDKNRDFLQGMGYLFQIPTARNLLTGAGAARSWPDNRCSEVQRSEVH